MKKIFLMLPLLGLMLACSGRSSRDAEAEAALLKQAEAIEQSAQRMEEVIEASAQEIDALQGEIDELLTDN
jgi:peptidoglycan hydrolase CwlO-like protein